MCCFVLYEGVRERIYSRRWSVLRRIGKAFSLCVWAVAPMLSAHSERTVEFQLCALRDETRADVFCTR
jgi:hypothetical protein